MKKEEELKAKLRAVLSLERNVKTSRKKAMLSREKVMKAEDCTFQNLEKFAANEKKVTFYTGLPSYAVFEVLLNGLVASIGGNESKFALEPWQSLLLTLMSVRLSLTLQDLAFFGASAGGYSVSD